MTPTRGGRGGRVWLWCLLVAEQADCLSAGVLVQAHGTESTKQGKAAGDTLLHARLLHFPLALQLPDHEHAVAPDFEGEIGGVAVSGLDAANQVVQGRDERVVLRLVVGAVAAKLEAPEALFAIGSTGDEVAAVSLTGIAEASAVKDQDVIGAVARLPGARRPARRRGRHDRPTPEPVFRT